MPTRRNPLLPQIMDERAGNPLAAPMSAADVWEANRPTLVDALRAAQSQDFWREAANQYAQALLAGSVAPGWRVFHGSPIRGLRELRPSEYGPMGPATYLTPAENVARRYADRDGLGTVYDLPYPENLFHGSGTTWLPLERDVNPYQVWRDQIAKVVQAAPPDKQQAIAALGQKLQIGDGYPFFRSLAQIMRGDDAAQELLRKSGFAGMTGLVDGPEIAYFGSLPIKGGSK